MLDQRFVEQIVVVAGFAGLRVENLFFDLGVNLQGEADLLRQTRLALFITVL
jgi:hypothetical protein